MGWLRKVTGRPSVLISGLISGLIVGLVVGFIGGLLRRRTPTHYVSDRHAPPADL